MSCDCPLVCGMIFSDVALEAWSIDSHLQASFLEHSFGPYLNSHQGTSNCELVFVYGHWVFYVCFWWGIWLHFRYTSLGSMNNTHPNPSLQYVDGSGIVRYKAAYDLLSDDEERDGRNTWTLQSIGLYYLYLFTVVTLTNNQGVNICTLIYFNRTNLLTKASVVLPSLLSTGWFQERNQMWFQC